MKFYNFEQSLVKFFKQSLQNLCWPKPELFIHGSYETSRLLLHYCNCLYELNCVRSFTKEFHPVKTSLVTEAKIYGSRLSVFD